MRVLDGTRDEGFQFEAVKMEEWGGTSEFWVYGLRTVAAKNFKIEGPWSLRVNTTSSPAKHYLTPSRSLFSHSF